MLAPHRKIEWELSTSVVEGRITSFQRIDDEGKDASAGPRFVVMLSVAKVLKGTGVKNGQTLRLEGWVIGKKRQFHMPAVSTQVVAFLKKTRNGGHDLLYPSGFLSARSTNTKQSSEGKIP